MGCTMILIFLIPATLPAPLEGPGQGLLDNAGLNSVPMLGKKRAPMDLPSFTSGFLPPAHPKYMRLRTNNPKRDEEKRAPWTGAWANIMAAKPEAMYRNQGGKRMPWSGNWASLMAQPQSTNAGAPATKRSAVASDWNIGYNNLLRAPQGFRFHSGGQDYLLRDLMYKRAKEVADAPSKKNTTEDRKKKSAESAPEPVNNQEEVIGAFGFEGIAGQQEWLGDFEALMADASLDHSDSGPEKMRLPSSAPRPVVEGQMPGWVLDVMNMG